MSDSASRVGCPSKQVGHINRRSLKERSYVPSHARRPDSNICMLEVSAQPYFFGSREILFWGLIRS